MVFTCDISAVKSLAKISKFKIICFHTLMMWSYIYYFYIFIYVIIYMYNYVVRYICTLKKINSFQNPSLGMALIS